MNVVGLSGFSGSGKTTLAERLIAALRAAGQRVSVVKHAHHKFDIDHEGKDSWRHRQAGASEVVIASARRLAKIREFPVRADPTVHELIAELAPCDWVLVEGFKSSALPKIEVWRAENGKPARYGEDPHIVAVATDDPRQLPVPTTLPVLDLTMPPAVVAFLLADPGRYLYRPPGRDGAGPSPAPAGVARVPARALRRSGGREVEEQVADEVPMAIEIGGVHELALFATPTDLDDLVLGLLLGEGIAEHAGDLLEVETRGPGRGPRAAAAPGAAATAAPAGAAGAGDCERPESAAAVLVAGEPDPGAPGRPGRDRPCGPGRRNARARGRRGSLEVDRCQPRRRLDLFGRRAAVAARGRRPAQCPRQAGRRDGPRRHRSGQRLRRGHQPGQS